MPRQLSGVPTKLPLIVQYRNLFSVMGTIYGGDGITTLALPKVAMRTESGAMLTACVVVAGQYPQRPR
jgi:microcystin-dependent protein